MASDESVDFKVLYLKEKEQRLRAEGEAAWEKEQRVRAEEEADRERQRNLRTTLEEFIPACHNAFSVNLKVREPAKSTQGSIGKRTGKLCPTYLHPWANCLRIQEAFYRRVCEILPPTDRLFSSLAVIEEIGRKYRRPLGSEKDLEFHERLAVEQHVHDVIAELCKIPEARTEFSLGEGVQFENHANTIDDDGDGTKLLLDDPESTAQRAFPDQFCVHRLDDGVSTLLTTVEYKPPHKLPVEFVRVALRPMNLWEEVVQRETIPNEKNEKLIYNAELLTASTLVQEYHVMITEGLEFSYVTNGLAYVLLYIQEDEPNILYYCLCEPSMDITSKDDPIVQQSKTAIARVLSLCLMSCSSSPRNHEWRHNAMNQLPRWETDLNYERAQISDTELRETPPGSEYVPSSSSGSPAPDDYSPFTKSGGSCAPTAMGRLSEPDSSDSDSQRVAPRRKRNLSQLTSSPPTLRLSRQRPNPSNQGGHRQHTESFCTQRCLLGLQRGEFLDENCPNVARHRGDNPTRHAITVTQLVYSLEKQLGRTLDSNCTPCGDRGAYGAPFKITCCQYGYTVLGKGTTVYRWSEISREAEIYCILRKAQGSAVPVFLGSIELEKVYFLHGAGQIKHMLLMGWGGKSTTQMERDQTLRKQIEKSKREILALGVIHEDFRPDNILWNAELGRALIIDFHRSRLVHRVRKRNKSIKCSSAGIPLTNTKKARAA
ncbi:hypothetical protein FQN57_000647 [Myotisia sp. PD_48]|nr:hypothetical protein FQN57_000647 [Myotisia sp. PD_48]